MGGADLIFRAALRNPNGFSCRIDKVTYRIDLVGVKVAVLVGVDVLVGVEVFVGV